MRIVCERSRVLAAHAWQGWAWRKGRLVLLLLLIARGRGPGGVSFRRTWSPKNQAWSGNSGGHEGDHHPAQVCTWPRDSKETSLSQAQQPDLLGHLGKLFPRGLPASSPREALRLAEPEAGFLGWGPSQHNLAEEDTFLPEGAFPAPAQGLPLLPLFRGAWKGWNGAIPPPVSWGDLQGIPLGSADHVKWLPTARVRFVQEDQAVPMPLLYGVVSS